MADVLRANALDTWGTRRKLFSSAAIDSVFDFNRDGRVDALDLAIERAAQSQSLPLLNNPIPAAASPGGAV